MIDSIRIRNYKSVVDLQLDLGSFNVLIGENGCGKSNILEAIGFAGAASADKLDFGSLGRIGIRVTNPRFMTSAFKNTSINKSIEILIESNSKINTFNIVKDENSTQSWIDTNRLKISNLIKINEDLRKESKKFIDITEKVELKLDPNDRIDFIKRNLSEKLHDYSKTMDELYEKLKSSINNPTLSNYIIYSPEETKLRRFDDTTQIKPLGIKGEGLFQYLKELSFDAKNKAIITEIKNNLELLDWYETFELPNNLMSNEFALNIKDRFVKSDTLQYFDQRSANEGFLYLLFYFTLFISKTTPSFFAIDNIDSAFNPKLCMALTENLAKLAKKHKKQAIVTTHSPAILDGLDLKDDSQRLFVISRNSKGHTVAKRIEYNKDRKMKLSEIWTKGYIGGLPNNF